MITDDQTNFVWFSELLRQKPEYQSFHKQLVALLHIHSMAHDYLIETNDIWCRDYMPVQVSGDKFVDFSYDPEYRHVSGTLKTYADKVCELMGRKAIKSDIILDGSQVIKGEIFVILTGNVLEENKLRYTFDRLTGQLTELFEVEKVIIIPCVGEESGCRGTIRWLGQNHVLIGGFGTKNDFPTKRSVIKALEESRLNFSEFSLTRHQSDQDLSSAYLAYLHMENLLIVPQFGVAEDQEALSQFRMLFPAHAAKNQIETLDVSAFKQKGGMINDLSWNIRV
jgi:agmatine/peptidylarginine deiminase